MRLTRLGPREDGSTSSIGLAIAAAIMAGGMVLAQALVSQPPAIDPRTALYDAEAAAALDVIVRDPGRTTTGGAWGLAPDAISRFGLTLEGTPNFIDYVKVRALRNGSLEDLATNVAPDYPEVQRAIGITDKDFHLRTYPVMPGNDDPRWTKWNAGRVAYFGHYASPTVPAAITSGAVKTSESLNVTLTIKNLGSIHAVFVASVALSDDEGKKDVVIETRHTPLIAPGTSATVWVRFDKLASWNNNIEAVHVKVTDAYRNVAVDAAGNEIGDFMIDETPPTGSGVPYGHRVHAGADYYHLGSANPTFWVRDHDGNGKHTNNAKAIVALFGPNGREWRNTSVVTIPANGYELECTNCTMVGNYTVVAWDKDLKRRHVDTVHVSAAQMFTKSLTLHPIAAAEASYLADLINGFNPTRYNAATNPMGDLYGDETNGPNEIMDVLSNYGTLIIGSDVKQTALTPATTKQGIRDWVKAGGNLIVLGTVRQSSEWLEPIYSAAQTNANGGISAPDATHPILVTPNRLDYPRYLDRGRAWDIDKDEPFTHVLTRGESGDSMQDTLAVSAPGALENGTVVLTSYMPGSLTQPQDAAEAKRFLSNLLSQSYTMLFLDYGPPIPDDVPVGSAQRLVAVPHPNVPGAVVEVKIVMYVFG